MLSHCAFLMCIIRQVECCVSFQTISISNVQSIHSCISLRFSQFEKKCHNIWGSVHHKPSEIFKKYSAEHNNGKTVGFIKPSECLQNALKVNVTSKEFIDLEAFKDASEIVMMDDSWAYLFLLCHALYAPMHVLCL